MNILKTDWKRMNIDVRFEVITAVTVKNAVFWDIKTQFIPHRRHILRYRAQSVNVMYDLRFSWRWL
jgi:hypothetical protein